MSAGCSYSLCSYSLLLSQVQISDISPSIGRGEPIFEGENPMRESERHFSEAGKPLGVLCHFQKDRYMSTRETNIRRLVQEAQEGISLSDLTERDRDDLWSVAKIDLSPYESNNWSADSKVYGELTLREVKLAQNLSKTLPLATQ